jgi:hypothetical protein
MQYILYTRLLIPTQKSVESCSKTSKTHLHPVSNLNRYLNLLAMTSQVQRHQAPFTKFYTPVWNLPELELTIMFLSYEYCKEKYTQNTFTVLKIRSSESQWWWQSFPFYSSSVG